MKRTTIVLGGGIVGISSALSLQERGHSVIVVDRKAPGRETSYGNAGLIQREAVEPYPLPRDPSELIQHAFGLSPAVHYHWRALPTILPKLIAYWRASTPARHAQISKEWATLIENSTSEHAQWIEQANAQELVTPKGFRFAWRQEHSFKAGVERAKRLQQTFGVQFRALGTDELLHEEPAITQRFVGAVHWTEPWAVSDPGELVSRYAALFAQRGGLIVQGDALSLQQTTNGWSVMTQDGLHEASDAIVALGPWADDALRPLGYHFPLFVKRGYHKHYQVERQLSMPLLCADDGVMLAPMRAGLRITTGAELTLRDAPATPVQLKMAERVAARALKIGKPVEDTAWLGARPCTPDMKPIIGAAPRHRGLWFNFGHAHQGFTLGPASARLLADMFDGKTPYINPAPFTAKRFDEVKQ
ncbi:FAD-binding oxidoreductase [Curvibacter sp. CHRR-16]|uniref:NAD(P)/FAD-dependent oxidoreductase n=1 Tax=Curvibacter sp. CHRR-16 TaxID=2835872 RepID=UPI001BDAC49E|nr:FAD-binding oxidoreductase [Curvibacter sp. CHRR-16]MBT0569767.1 FAD-binding oxidoreductase [Curvibacter sp. CHRR-16]